eukprot:4709272-Amphidinium_carterae.1
MWVYSISIGGVFCVASTISLGVAVVAFGFQRCCSLNPFSPWALKYVLAVSDSLPAQQLSPRSARAHAVPCRVSKCLRYRHFW